MAYRLRKPTLPIPRATSIPADAGGGAAPSPVTPAAHPPAPDTEAARRKLVMTAFQDMYRVLEPVLGDQWIGAWKRITTGAPAVARATDEVEAEVDRRALAFIRGQGPELDFRRALGGYEMALRRCAAAVLAQADPRRRCERCGEEEMTVALHTDDRHLFCSRCWLGHAV